MRHHIDHPPPPATMPSWADLFLAPKAAARSSLDCLLVGMVTAGLGIEAICLYLGLSRDELYLRVVALDLRTPHDRPLRKPGGKNPWLLADIQRLLDRWIQGLTGTAIARELGRSPGSIYSKARRLGLPKRQRRLLVRNIDELPALDRRVVPAPALLPGGGDVPVFGRLKDQLRPARLLFALPSDLVHRVRQIELDQGVSLMTAAGAAPTAPQVPKKQSRAGERTWTPEQEHELSMRVWAGQHRDDIAAAMGLTSQAVRSHMTRLEIPLEEMTERRSGRRPTYDETVALAAIKAFDMVEGFCRVKHAVFWTRRRGGQRDLSREGRRLLLGELSPAYF